MSTIAEPTRMTRTQYLAFERASDARHESFDGVVSLMSGVSRSHNRIALNLTAILDATLVDRPGELFASGVRVRFGTSYVYPDLTVAVEDPEFEDNVFDTLLNPAIVIEVLSPSTESFDRGLKADGYRGLRSVTDYLLIAQDRVEVEHWSRQAEGWGVIVRGGIDDAIRLESLALSITLRQVYAKVSPPGGGA